MAGRLLIVALVLWLAVGGCSTILLSCPLKASTEANHECCPRNQPTGGLKDCPFFVAVQAAIPDVGMTPVEGPAPLLDVSVEWVPAALAFTHTQHHLFLSIGVLRI